MSSRADWATIDFFGEVYIGVRSRCAPDAFREYFRRGVRGHYADLRKNPAMPAASLIAYLVNETGGIRASCIEASPSKSTWNSAAWDYALNMESNGPWIQIKDLSKGRDHPKTFYHGLLFTFTRAIGARFRTPAPKKKYNRGNPMRAHYQPLPDTKFDTIDDIPQHLRDIGVTPSKKARRIKR